MISQGFPPATVSTDLHAYSRDTVVDLPTVLSKLLALGMSLTEVLRAATLTPAVAVGLDAGTLRTGARADVAVLTRVAAPTNYSDPFGGSVLGQEQLRAVMT